MVGNHVGKAHSTKQYEVPHSSWVRTSGRPIGLISPVSPDMPYPRVVVIGLGHQGQRYCSILRDLGQRVVGFVDPLPRPVSGMETALTYRTLEDALGELAFEVAIVAVPHAFHYCTVSRLLDCGKHVVKEKPAR